MRKIVTFIVLIFTSLVISCGKDDEKEIKSPTDSSSNVKEDEEKEVPKKNPFVGTWEIVSMQINDKERVLSDCEKKSYAIFQETTFTTYIGLLTGGICIEKPINWTYTISDDIISGKSEEGLVAEIPFTFK
ncbi:lipocalin family protein [Capnocytophaga cynodegmi]|uniref:lipocalin family protein n=1 Tax=Capnocytophaga cynodegmi TaxID=28189 RepID=UPI003858C3DF